MAIQTQSDGLKAPQVSSEFVQKWRKRLEEESKREFRAIRFCFGVGLFFNGIVLLAGLLLGEIGARLGHNPRAEAYLFGICVAGSICAIMLVVAAFTKPDGRSETAKRIFEQGSDAAGDHPEGALGVSVAMVIALYGGYAIVEATNRALMRIRLSNVDRDQTARILAEVCNVPAGVHWKNLLQTGQSLHSLRGPIALLMLDGWIEIVDGGQTVAQRTPAMRRALHRHPLAEVFPLETG